MNTRNGLNKIFLLSIISLLILNSSAWAMDQTASTPKPQAKALSMVRHTFPDVKIGPQGQTVAVTVSLPFQYKSVNPDETRFFHQGEALIVDPKTSQFETYVTSPLLPCLFARILDTKTGKSLVFHKYGSHNLESLLPFWEEFAPSSPENLHVVLYTVQLSDHHFAVHKSAFGGRTQIQEMNAVRDFFKNTYSIPEGQIERRFFRAQQNLSLPKLGQYETTPTTVGITKSGDIFHTGLLAINFTGRKTERKDRNLPEAILAMKRSSEFQMWAGLVKQRYDQSQSFFTLNGTILDVPASALGDLIVQGKVD